MLPELEVVFGRDIQYEKERLARTNHLLLYRYLCWRKKRKPSLSKITNIHFTNRSDTPQSFALSSFPMGVTPFRSESRFCQNGAYQPVHRGGSHLKRSPN